MHCYCCDCELSDAESTRRNAVTGEFLDMCDDCLNVAPEDFLVIERDDLKTEHYDWEDDYFDYRE